MLRRVLIANRGAIARRIVRACRELNVESVCCHSDIDAQTPAVVEADDAARLPGYRAKDTYLNAQAILEAATRCRVDSIHPGYGFLAESSSFANQVEQAGLVFVGPSPSWIERMSEKTQARTEMRDCGVPTHEGSGTIKKISELLDFVEKVGLPVVLKPAAGGGGIGMFVVEDIEQLETRYSQARALAKASFSDDSLYAEKYLSRPRHIEFQLVGDGTESFIVGERECSVQRRHQKLIEETPAPGIHRNQLEEIQDCLIGAVAGYDSVGTVECLYANERFGFLEMNTRLQVEHGVTEEATGLDLVALQLRIAGGESLSSRDCTPTLQDQFAVEARLYAEDSTTMLPSAGKLNTFRPVQFEGVRIETAYRTGNYVTPYYDPLLAKIIGSGTSREQAIARTALALKAFDIEGVATNSALLQNILGSEAFILGRIHTQMVSDLFYN